MRELLSGATGGVAADLVGTYLDVERPPPPDRPWVVADFVVSPDGSVATGGRVGGLSSPSDQQVFRLLRAAGDAVLVGAGTVRAEGYGPHRPAEEHRAWRSARGLAPAAAIAVVSASLELDYESALFTRAERRTLLVVPGGAAEAARRRAAAVADLLLAGEARVDLAAALRGLRERGSRVVVCEGGPKLLAELLAGGLVDEVCLTLAPLLVADPVRLLPDGALSGPRKLVLDSVLEDDGHLFLRYLLDEGSAP
jgi:riboflavin biosynthesis pyrimidine reductase